MNKVATDSAMGIADKDLSEELQVRSEQPQEVECKCLAPHRFHWSLFMHWRLRTGWAMQAWGKRAGGEERMGKSETAA
jgi:hypothetical protein